MTILYSLNIFLTFYLEITLQLITIFNYKNFTIFTDKFNIFDIFVYVIYRNNKLTKILINLN